MLKEAAKEAISPFSGHASREVWGARGGQLIYRCPTTGALFFDRAAITPDTYQDFYPYLKDFDAARFRWELAIRRRHFRKQLKLMARYVTGRKLADIGAGPGYLCAVAKEEGWDAVGVEISEPAFHAGAREFGIRYRGLDEIEDGSLDVITCHHVFEHVERPREFLGVLKSKLKPGGLLDLHVPHQQPLTFWLRGALDRLTGKGKDTRCALYDNIHISGFTASSLRRVVEAGGFTPHFITGAGMWSKFYEPFFFKDFVTQRQWGALIKKTVRHAVETLGVPLGCGDWVVGYFAKK